MDLDRKRESMTALRSKKKERTHSKRLMVFIRTSKLVSCLQGFFMSIKQASFPKWTNGSHYSLDVLSVCNSHNITVKSQYKNLITSLSHPIVMQEVLKEREREDHQCTS